MQGGEDLTVTQLLNYKSQNTRENRALEFTGSMVSKDNI